MTIHPILAEFDLFALGGEGLGGWLTERTDLKVFERLARIDAEPLSLAQLNQLLVFGRQAPISQGFYSYYWMPQPNLHPYDVTNIPGFTGNDNDSSEMITSLSQFKWGLYRIFVDALLYFGNVRTAFREMRTLSRSELESFYGAKRFNPDRMKRRGKVLDLEPIARDNRYLIAENACKSFGEGDVKESDLREALKLTYAEKIKAGKRRVRVKELIKDGTKAEYANRQGEFEFSIDELLNDEVSSQDEIDEKFEKLWKRYKRARAAAMSNTHHYLGMVNDLDVYVATSMRNRDDFRNMARFCGDVFEDNRLADLDLRYFDPTMSAAPGHEDKGLIECLMVKCAKVLVYCAGDKESYGKDAEAAMALSFGKPVIFYCDSEEKSRFYREVHPLSRLIEFNTGVAVGAMVTDSVDEVVKLLGRLFMNRMSYELELHPERKKFLRLKETVTESVVRLQTDNQMLTETFWNHYHNVLPTN